MKAELRRLLVGVLVIVALLGACTNDERGAPDATTAVTSSLAQSGRGSPLGAKWDWPRYEMYKALIEGLGGATFYEFEWCQVEPEEGHRSWQRVDRNVDRLVASGLRPYLKVRIGSCWATGGSVDEPRGAQEKTPSAMPLNTAAYRDFVEEAVRRYTPRGVRTYAIENEANVPEFWAGTPLEYGTLVREGAAAVHGSGTDARVFDSGLSSTAYGVGIARHLLEQGREQEAVAAYNRYYERRLPARAQDFPPASSAEDLVHAFHTEQGRRNLAYLDATFALVRDGVIDGYQLHFYEHWSQVEPLLEFVRSEAGNRLPIEAWEAGIFWPASSGDLDVLADETTKLVVSLLGGGVDQVIFLPLAWDPGGTQDREVRWGLFEPDGSPRPAAAALLQIAASTSGGETRWERIAHDQLQGVVLKSSEHWLWLIWSDSVTTITPSSPEAEVTVHDNTGTPLACCQGGLEVGVSPLLVRTPVGARLE